MILNWVKLSQENMPKEGETVFIFYSERFAVGEILYFDEDNTPNFLVGDGVYNNITHLAKIPNYDIEMESIPSMIEKCDMCGAKIEEGNVCAAFGKLPKNQKMTP